MLILLGVLWRTTWFAVTMPLKRSMIAELSAVRFAFGAREEERGGVKVGVGVLRSFLWKRGKGAGA